MNKRPVVAPLGRVGHGQAFGAVTILNATATGIGCSLAIDLPTHATWAWEAGSELRLETMGADDRLGRAVRETLLEESSAGVLSRANPAPANPSRAIPSHPTGAHATVHCPFPPSRGLKTSSSVAAALVRAAFDAVRQEVRDEDTERLSVAASRRAGVTITGAFDDQVAVVRGGCHLTDNQHDRILAVLPAKAWHVAVWIADRPIPKPRVEGLDTTPIRAPCAKAEAMARDGNVPEAMTENGRIFSRFYREFGLPIDDAPTEAALAHGALGAGLSGTGPAVAALFDRPTDLPPSRGGRWLWTQAVPHAS